MSTILSLQVSWSYINIYVVILYLCKQSVLNLGKVDIDKCDIMYAPMQGFRTRTSGWMFPKNSILQPMFDKYKLKLYQNGVIKKLHETFLPMPKCNHEQPFFPVNFDFVAMIFYVLIMGSILAIIIGIGEKMKAIFLNKIVQEEESPSFGIEMTLSAKSCIFCSRRRSVQNIATQT